jgi:hypothetical protein
MWPLFRALVLIGLGVAATLAVGACLTGSRKQKPVPNRFTEYARDRDMVDEASEESFPASDPPSWNPTTSIGSPG